MFIRQSSEFFLASLLRNPEELCGLGLNFGDQLVNVEQKDVGRSVDCIHHRIGAASEVGELRRRFMLGIAFCFSEHTHLSGRTVGGHEEGHAVLVEDPLQEFVKCFRGRGACGFIPVSQDWGSLGALGALGDPGVRNKNRGVYGHDGCGGADGGRRAIGDHTSVAEGIHHLVCLLLVVEFPGLFEWARRSGLGGRALILFAEFEAIEDKDAADTEVFEGLELFLDVAPQGEGESTERAQQRFPGGLVDEVLGEVVRRIDSDNGAFEGGKREGLGATHGPFIKGTDYGKKDTVRGVKRLGQGLSYSAW